MAGALEGVRVVDLTAMFNGPLATMILGDQGANVIKVEPPGTGDVIRQFGLQRADIGPIFQSVNRNKRSVVLDLQDARGRDRRDSRLFHLLSVRSLPGPAAIVGSRRSEFRTRHCTTLCGTIQRPGDDRPCLRENDRKASPTSSVPTGAVLRTDRAGRLDAVGPNHRP